MPFNNITLLELLDRLTDRWENVPFWTKEEGIRAIDESLRVFNSLTGHWRDKTDVTALANAHWVALPRPIAYSVRIDIDGVPLDQTSLGDLDNGHPSWENEDTSAGDPVPSAIQLWAPAGCDLIAVWPRPTVSTVLTVDGVLATPVLHNDEDLLNASDSEVHPLLDMALHIAAFKEGSERWKHTEKHYKSFLRAAADRNDRFKSTSFYRRYMGLDEDRPRRPVRREAEAAIQQAISEHRA